MTFKEFIVSRLQLYFFLVTMILLAQITLGNIIEPDRVLHYKDFIGTFFMAGLCTLPTFLSYSKKEPTLKIILIRQALQLLLIEGIMIVLAVKGVEDTPQKTMSIVLICVSVAVIYILAVFLMWYRQHVESRKLTELLKNIQNS